MAKPTRGELRWTNEGWVARITLQGKTRRSYPLPGCETETSARVRMQALADAAQQFRKAGVLQNQEPLSVLDTIASSADDAHVRELQAKARVIAGLPEKVPETMREFGELWTSGVLHKEFPDKVRSKKDGVLDARRLRSLWSIDVGGMRLGDIDVERFTVKHGEIAMRHLPASAKTKATRRAYAQVLRTLLGHAARVGLIPANPLPPGFLPRIGEQPRFPFLHPAEDARLMRCSDVPLERRVLYGFLARQGWQFRKAAEMTFRELDLSGPSGGTFERDGLRWPLAPGVADGLRAWKAHRGPGEKRVFVDEHGRPLTESLATELRADLRKSGAHRSELSRIRVQDLRATFIALALANGWTDEQVVQHVGVNRLSLDSFREQARSAAELGLGPLASLVDAIPELARAEAAE